MRVVMRRAIGVLALAATAVFTGTARANLDIAVSEDGGAPTNTATGVGSPSDPGGVSAVIVPTTFSTAHYTITILGGTATQSAAHSILQSAAVSITGLAGSSAHTLNIVINGTGYTLPVTPPPVNVLSHIGGTVAVGDTANTMTYHSIVDGNDIGAQKPAIKAIGSYANDKSAGLASLANPFAIKETVDIVLSTGSTINFSASTTLNSVPEPSTVVMAGMGALGLVGFAARRRKAVGA